MDTKTHDHPGPRDEADAHRRPHGRHYATHTAKEPPSHRPARMVVISRSWRRLFVGALGFAAWLGLWQLATAVWPLAETEGLPTAVETLRAAVTLGTGADFRNDVAITLVDVVIATLIVTVLGLVLGIAMGRSEVVRSLIEPTSQFLRPIPAIVVLPLLLLVCGPTNELAIVLAVVGGIWPMVIQAEVGVRSVDPVTLDTGRAMGLSAWRTQTAIVLPSALPFFATGARIAGSLTLMLMIGAGILGGAPGLGHSVMLAQQSGQSAVVFANLLWSGAIGLGVNGALTALENQLSRGRRAKAVS
jgi:ABC-type nitrate/sulfonate/bicarbonate transport system permease component